MFQAFIDIGQFLYVVTALAGLLALEYGVLEGIMMIKERIWK